MPISQPFFPSYNRTPKHHGYLNTLHPNPRDEFRTCWGRVEEFPVAGEQEIVHTKPFFFPFLSAATYTNHPFEVDQRECEVVGGISDGPEDGGPEEEEAPADDDTGGTSKIGGGGEMGVEDAGDEVDCEGKGVGGAVDDEGGDEGTGLSGGRSWGLRSTASASSVMCCTDSDSKGHDGPDTFSAGPEGPEPLTSACREGPDTCSSSPNGPEPLTSTWGLAAASPDGPATCSSSPDGLGTPSSLLGSTGGGGGAWAPTTFKISESILRNPQHYRKQLKRPWNQARRGSRGLEGWLKEKPSRNFWRERLKTSNLVEVDAGAKGYRLRRENERDKEGRRIVLIPIMGFMKIEDKCPLFEEVRLYGGKRQTPV
ncbi:hypothetical protein Taro_046354, partial [Colocasia esculenta]|nr:hypothetical protein [Colocasia esculenta]